MAVRGLINLGGAYMTRRDYTGAEKYFREGLTLARANNSPRWVASSLANLASSHEQLKRAGDTAAEAKAVLPAERLRQGGGAMPHVTGAQQLLSERLRRGLGLFRSAAAMAERTGDKNLMALSQESLGSVLEARQLYPEALAHYRKRLEWSVTSDAKAYGAFNARRCLAISAKPMKPARCSIWRKPRETNFRNFT